jgi:hypothetical protein
MTPYRPQVHGTYCDQLTDFSTEATGLATSL